MPRIKTIQHQDCFKVFKSHHLSVLEQLNGLKTHIYMVGPAVISNRGISNPAGHGKHGTVVNIRTSPKCKWSWTVSVGIILTHLTMPCNRFRLHLLPCFHALQAEDPGPWTLGECCPPKMALKCLAITVGMNLESLG